MNKRLIIVIVESHIQSYLRELDRQPRRRFCGPSIVIHVPGSACGVGRKLSTLPDDGQLMSRVALPSKQDAASKQSEIPLVPVSSMRPFEPNQQSNRYVKYSEKA